MFAIIITAFIAIALTGVWLTATDSRILGYVGYALILVGIIGLVIYSTVLLNPS